MIIHVQLRYNHFLGFLDKAFNHFPTTMLITKFYDDDHLGFAISIKTNGHFAKSQPRIIHILSNFTPLSSFF